MIAKKRKYVYKTLREKCESLKDLEKGLSNKDVTAKYGVPKNILSTWVKSKEKLFAALEKGNNVKRQKLRTRDHETLDPCLQMVFKFAKSKRPNMLKSLRSYVDGRRETTSPSKQYLEN